VIRRSHLARVLILLSCASAIGIVSAQSRSGHFADSNLSFDYPAEWSLYPYSGVTLPHRSVAACLSTRPLRDACVSFSPYRHLPRDSMRLALAFFSSDPAPRQSSLIPDLTVGGYHVSIARGISDFGACIGIGAATRLVVTVDLRSRHAWFQLAAGICGPNVGSREAQVMQLLKTVRFG